MNRQSNRANPGAWSSPDDRWLLTFIQNLGEGVGIVDTEERFVFANPAGEEIFGVAPGALVGRCLFDFVSPAQAAIVRTQTGLRIQGHKSEYELEIVRESDQASRTILVSATPERDDRGRVSGTRGVFRDITERKRVETALQESEERLRLAAEANRMGTFDIYPLTGKRIWSRRTKRMFGFPADVDVSYEAFIGAVHPEDRARVHAEVQDLLTSPQSPKSFSEFRTAAAPDGQVRWLASWARTFFDEQGQAVRMIGITQDITERKRAEEALRESEARLRLTFDHAPIGAVMVGMDHRLLRVNTAFGRFLGYAEEELAGRHMRDISHPDHRDIDRANANLLKEGKAELYRTDKRYLRRDGTVVWGHATVRLLRDASGQPLYFVGMVEDITEHRKAAEEQERLQAQLLHAQKMESIGRLAGGVAHDFNNLLTVINGYSTLALNKLRLEDPLREIIQEVHRAGETAAALVRQLLAFSRRQLLRQEPVDLNGMLRDLEKTLLPLLGEDIEIATSLRPGLLPVLGDRHQIEQVILNLAVNARDAMPQGGSLTIETDAVTCAAFCPQCLAPMRPGRYVRVTVRDTGVGMDAETQQHLFEPFFSTKEAGQGTGLGLATVHGIILQSGGHIDVESRPGRGSSFQIYLPAAEAPLNPPPAVEAGAETGHEGGSETILLVEDQPEVRRFVAAVLEECGYRVLTASSAEEALSECASQQVDLLLTDVVMPKMNGCELAAVVRSRQPQAQVLFMSGHSEEMLAGHADLRGAAFLQKPFAPGALAEKVRQALKSRTA